MQSPFDLLMLGVQILIDAGGDPDPFLQQVKHLQTQWVELQVDIAQLQQFIYDAVQFEWKRQGKDEEKT